MDYNQLSKEISYALRHAPWEYNLKLDDEGWVSIEQLLSSLNATKTWENLKLGEIVDMINCSEKKRHEICGGKIRAFYGHSTPTKIRKQVEKPPNVLYHGTARRLLSDIMANALLPQSRQYVHLSEDIETAFMVGKRRDNQPVILRVYAANAYKDGLSFYAGNEKVWLAQAIPSAYLEKI